MCSIRDAGLCVSKQRRCDRQPPETVIVADCATEIYVSVRPREVVATVTDLLVGPDQPDSATADAGCACMCGAAAGNLMYSRVMIMLGGSAQGCK